MEILLCQLPDWANWVRSRTQFTFIGIEEWQWVGLIVALLAALVGGWIVYWTVVLLGARNPKVRDLVYSATHGRGIKITFAIAAASLLFEAGASNLNLEQGVLRGLVVWIVFVRILAIGWLAANIYAILVEAALHRSAGHVQREHKILFPFLQKIGLVSIVIVTFVAALAEVGTNVWGMVAGLGIGGVAIAFAAKDSVENVFGSVTVMLDMPFTIGDWVKINGQEGIVEQINLRSTRIRTVEDSILTMPNSNFIKASVENLGQRRSRRFTAKIPLKEHVPFDQLVNFSELTATKLRELDRIQEGSVVVAITEVIDTGPIMQVAVRFEVDSYTQEMAMRQSVLSVVLSNLADFQESK